MALTIHDQRMAKYGQVMTDLIRRIGSGEWRVGETIPSVLELQRAYGFNRLTILKALNRLESEGYLSVEQGRGTFVRRKEVRKLVGLCFGDDIFSPEASPFSFLMARAAQAYFRDSGSELKYYVEHANLKVERVLDRDLVDDIVSGRLRGLITVGSDAPLALVRSDLWARHRLPWVDVSVHDVATHRVQCDVLPAMTLGVGYLQRTGRRRIAALGMGKDSIPATLAPFHRLLAARGMATRPEWTPQLRRTSERGGFDGMRAIWACPEKPDALLVMDDILAKGAVQAIQTLGIRVPQDVALISLANKGSGLFYPISFPRLEFDPQTIMRKAGKLLETLMARPDAPPRTIRVAPVLREA